MTTNTNRQYRRLEWSDPEAWNSDGILKDDVSVRLPMFMIDGKMKMADVHTAMQVVNSGRYNRPGFRSGLQQDAAAAADARADAYLEYETRLTRAYKDARGDDPDVGFGENGSLDLQVGDVCTVSTGGGKFGPEGSRGHVKMVNGVLTCVADHLRAGGSEDPRDSMTDARTQAYLDYDRQVSLQWATGKGKPAIRDASRGDGMTAKAAAYQAYDESISQQWRNPTA